MYIAKSLTIAISVRDCRPRYIQGGRKAFNCLITFERIKSEEQELDYLSLDQIQPPFCIP